MQSPKMSSPKRVTPDILLWAHQLKREHGYLLDRIKQLESVTTPKQSILAKDSETITRLTSRLAGLEQDATKRFSHEVLLASLDGRVGRIEARLNRLEEDSKVNVKALQDAKGLVSRFEMLDTEVADQAKDFKAFKGKAEALEEGASSSTQRVQDNDNTATEIQDRLAAIDTSLMTLEQARDESFRNLLNTDRSVSKLSEMTTTAKDSVSTLASELKWHLGQLYGHCETIEIRVGQRSSGGTQIPAFETQQNLERKWDEQCGSMLPAESQISQIAPNSLQRYDTARTPDCQPSARAQLGSDNLDHEESPADPFNPQGQVQVEDHDHRAASPLRTIAEGAQDRGVSRKLDYGSRASGRPSEPTWTAPNMRGSIEKGTPFQRPGLEDPFKRTENVLSTSSFQNRLRPSGARFEAPACLANDIQPDQEPRREEDIETQSPTPTPPPPSKNRRHKGTGIMREFQRLLEPNFHSGSRSPGPFTVEEVRKTRSQKQAPPSQLLTKAPAQKPPPVSKPLPVSEPSKAQDKAPSQNKKRRPTLFMGPLSKRRRS